MALTKQERRKRIKQRIRKIISGTADRPRMNVFRSNKQIFVQLINDVEGNTLLAASSRIKDIAEKKATKSEKAAMVGKLVADKALAAGITEVVFDRNGYLYHGRVKQLADAARKGGLKF
ncbi:MAG: 50S ribosomal protein L18 [Chlorobi bacterium]|nr:50S ribosomal protein L18 [Chlorobiota bacterium]